MGEGRAAPEPSVQNEQTNQETGWKIRSRWINLTDIAVLEFGTRHRGIRKGADCSNPLQIPYRTFREVVVLL